MVSPAFKPPSKYSKHLQKLFRGSSFFPYLPILINSYEKPMTSLVLMNNFKCFKKIIRKYFGNVHTDKPISYILTCRAAIHAHFTINLVFECEFNLLNLTQIKV